MFIPLHDANKLRHIRLQYVTFGLIAVNIAVFLFTATAGTWGAQAAALSFGYIPAVAYEHAVLPADLDFVPGYATYLTYSFVHADIFHLGGNMLFLWVFGDNIEDALGHFRFLVFYLACSVAGALAHGFVAPMSQAPLIGASGAVAGVVAAYLLLHPRVKIWVLAFGRIPLRVPAWIALVLWIALQFVMFAAGGEDQISWTAHVGGILAGTLLVVLMKRRDVPLFDRKIVRPRAVRVGSVPSVPRRAS